MILAGFVSMVAEVMILLLGITAPIFIFCLMYGFLRPMFNNWLQNIFAGILTILFTALSLRIVVNYLNLVLNKATKVADSSTIVELGAQVCLAGIFAAILVYISAKVAAALAGQALPYPCRAGRCRYRCGCFGAGKLAGVQLKKPNVPPGQHSGLEGCECR